VGSSPGTGNPGSLVTQAGSTEIPISLR
jgi:hypothetical protein